MVHVPDYLYGEDFTARPVPPVRSVLSIAQFCRTYPVWTESAIRSLIFNAAARQSSKGEAPGNGLAEFGAIHRLGRKVLIDDYRFFKWLDARQNKARFEQLLGEARRDPEGFLKGIDVGRGK